MWAVRQGKEGREGSAALKKEVWAEQMQTTPASAKKRQNKRVGIVQIQLADTLAG